MNFTLVYIIYIILFLWKKLIKFYSEKQFFELILSLIKCLVLYLLILLFI